MKYDNGHSSDIGIFPPRANMAKLENGDVNLNGPELSKPFPRDCDIPCASVCHRISAYCTSKCLRNAHTGRHSCHRTCGSGLATGHTDSKRGEERPRLPQRQQSLSLLIAVAVSNRSSKSYKQIAAIVVFDGGRLISPKLK